MYYVKETYGFSLTLPFYTIEDFVNLLNGTF